MKKWGFITGIFLCLTLAASARAGEPAPDFTATTTSGRNYSSSSLRGQNVLVEFWTTWCTVCRGEQAAVDSISREFAGRGLVVLAVDSYETSAEAREYLAQHPRSCNVVLNEDTDLVASFRPPNFPYYVLIDRRGEIAGTQDGGAGEEALHDLLENVGLVDRSSRAPGEESAPPVLHYSTPKLIEVPRSGFLAHPKPLTPVVFILKSGEKVETRRYTIASGEIRIVDLPEPRTIPLDALNRAATLAANHKRGVNLRIPANANDVYLGF